MYVLIPAAGIGTRMGDSIPKQYLTVCGKTILERTVDCFLSYRGIEKILLVLAKDDSFWSKLQTKLPQDKILTTIGAETRYQSVYQGLLALTQIAHPDDWVLVHDAVRPCLRQSDLHQLIAVATNHPVGGLLAIPVTDTLKRSNEAGAVLSTVDRSCMWQAQTPQLFKLGRLTVALSRAISEGYAVTDEANAMELLGEAPLLVPGHADNIKVTMPRDLALVEKFFKGLASQELSSYA